jgi:hypothetical protein
MLVVLCVVVVLAGFVLRQSGLAGGGMQHAAPVAPARVTTGGTGPAAAPEAAPRPLDALGVARGLESTVQQQADAYEKRIDAGVR